MTQITRIHPIGRRKIDLRVMVTPAEKQAVKDEARRRQLTVSDMLRTHLGLRMRVESGTEGTEGTL